MAVIYVNHVGNRRKIEKKTSTGKINDRSKRAPKNRENSVKPSIHQRNSPKTHCKPEIAVREVNRVGNWRKTEKITSADSPYKVKTGTETAAIAFDWPTLRVPRSTDKIVVGSDEAAFRCRLGRCSRRRFPSDEMPEMLSTAKVVYSRSGRRRLGFSRKNSVKFS